MIYVVLIISFLLDGFISTIIGSNSLFFPLFTLLALIIICPFFKKKETHKFLFIAAFTGMLYDIVYTNTFMLNIGMFLLSAILIKFIFQIYASNIVSNILISILLIILYRSITYFAFVISGYLAFSFTELLRGVYSSLMINILYIAVSYLLTILISKKFNIQRFS